jgi:hypothetical protein
MGSRMRIKRKAFTGTVAWIVTALTVSAALSAGGVGLGIPFYVVDLTGTFAGVPGAVENALYAFGVPTADVDEIVGQVEDGLISVPRLFPIPLLGGEIEVSLPFLLIDGLRFAGGGINDRLVWEMLDLVGAGVPERPFEGIFESDGFEVAVSSDPSFYTLMLSTEVVKRLDLLVAGIEFGLGIDLVQGRVDLAMSMTAPGHQSEVAAALAALHPEGLFWSAFSGHASVGVELGLPFLRLVARVNALLPFRQTVGWWAVNVGGLAGYMGVTIRF